MTEKTQVFVVGGGPAGLAVAIAARQQGLEVMVADGARPPIDKACGEGLMPDGRAALRRLGVDIPAESSHTFRGIRFVSGGLSVEAAFPAEPGIGLRRTVLHRLMVDRAESLGVRLLWQTPVTGLREEGVDLGKCHVRSHWVVGADGGQSLVRSWIGLDRYGFSRKRFAFRRHYRVAPWSECVEIHWGPKCQVYVSPVAGDEICVALVSRDPHLRIESALAEFPEIAWRLRGAEPSSAEQGATSSTRRLQCVERGNVALVGDASGTVDCITGEGLCLAFRQAEALAQCFADGSLRGYQRQHRALWRRPAVMARMMLSLDWNLPFRQRVMRAFGVDPEIFQDMLAMHVGALSPLHFAANGVALGWRMLRV
jgi:flavin-dependent dehydrogenase